ncbi:MAG: MutS-related protein [Athalassotoga sp.]|uniref:MutS-related protein n=1 Tax=Athalassotoga sp. TaxID=2022597 RepID=UPI003D037E34
MEFIDESTKNFCLFDKVIDLYKPVSVFGKNLFANLSPLKEEMISYFSFLSKVRECEKQRTRIESLLRDFHEITTTISNIEHDMATEIDIFEIKRFIYYHRLLKNASCLKDFFGSFEELWILIDPQNTGSFSFAPRNSMIEEMEKKYTDLGKKIDGLYRMQIELIARRFGIRIDDKRFVIEKEKGIPLVNSNLVMIEREGTKTYTLSVRPTEEIISLQNEMSDLEENLKDEREREIKRLSSEIKKWIPSVKEEISKISKFDLAFSKVKAINDGYTFPDFGDRIELSKAFHPVIAKNVQNYTPLDGSFTGGLTIIFGPNMGGKTTVLKTIALSCALGTYGFLVPAKYAKLPKVDWIRYIGMSSNHTDLSSFANQIENVSEVLKMDGNGIILIDEFGAGTNPYEGEALAQSLAEYLSHRNHFSIMVTHFKRVIEKTNCPKYMIGKINFDEEINAKNINSKIDHHLTKDFSVKYGDAIKIASIFGFPSEITDEALKKLEDYL